MNVKIYRRLAAHMPQALLLLTPSGRVRLANRAAAALLGSVTEGTSVFADLADPESFRRYLALAAGSSELLPGTLRPARANAATLRVDCCRLESVSEGDEPLLLLYLRTLPEASQRFRLLNEQIEELHREIRRREKAEHERERLLVQEREARALAEEANRLKDEFLATISHELRTPLNAIKGWIHLLRTAPHDRDLGARGLEIIERNTDAQVQLVEDLLDVSRAITGRIRLAAQTVDLDSVVAGAVEAVQPAAAAKDIAVDVTSGGPACAVQGDPDRLLQVVWNLLSNAVKFTPRGGRVELAVRRVDSRVEIEVSDSGEGISPDVLPFIFDRFRQGDGSTTRRHGGIGLGLSIVRHLVELHGGLVTAESPGKDQGATLTVRLPLPRTEPPTPRPSPPTSSPPPPA